MPATSSFIRWSEREPAQPIRTLEHLERSLDRVTAHAARPTIVVVERERRSLTLGLGSSDSFAQVAENDDPPYLVTVGDAAAQGEATFFFLGEHPTEIPRRNLVSASTGREIAREFVVSGRCSTVATWEEI